MRADRRWRTRKEKKEWARRLQTNDPGLDVTVQVPTYLGLDNSGRISEAMVDECENWATNCRHRWPC
jgi:hypothetical protein